MDIKLRLERSEDYRAVEELTREAFWNFMNPGCDEHLLAHKLRKSPSFVPELDYVAEADGKLVGNIMYSKAKVVSDVGVEYEVLNFGPLSVLPAYQNMGVGAALMRHTIGEAKQLGYRAILFFGHPDYYPRFGFLRAGEFGIATHSGHNYDAFMAMPLYDGALDGVTGRFYEDSAFELSAEEAEEFDKGFPHKERAVLTPIGVLLERLDAPVRDAIKGQGLKALVDLTRYSGREVAAWHGIDDTAKGVINATLKEYGCAPKVF